jgi:mxaA protein
MKRGLSLAGLARLAVAMSASISALAAPGVPRVEASEPRAYGYSVGDAVQRQVGIHVPEGWQFDDSSLPKSGARGGAIELRRVVARSAAESGGRRVDLTLDYQIFLAPTAVRTLEIPPLTLRVKSASRSEDLRVEAWPLTVAPLVPPEVSPRRGLGELQPDVAPPHLEASAVERRLSVYAAVAALLAAALAVERFGAPWRAARQRPFAQAWRQLRRLPADADAARWQAACKLMHAALNRSAREVLFEAGLPRFVAARPAMAGLQDEIARFLQRSRAEFFGGARREPDDARWLVGLARRLRDAEREGG